MPTCNLFEIVHNIWLQQSSNMGSTCLFATTYNDYVQAFKQSSLYFVLQGGASRTNPYKNELHMCRANQFGDPFQIVVAIAKYTSSFGLSTKISHLDGEEVFGLAKCKANPPLGSEGNSHWHDWVNFFHLKVANATTLINQLLAMDVGETSNFDHVITHNGVEALECLRGDNIYQIECCPLKSSNCCSALQKGTKHYYKIIIISKQTDHGIHAPCYVGYWSIAQGVSIELYKF